jgi:hypothetical protein
VPAKFQFQPVNPPDSMLIMWHVTKKEKKITAHQRRTVVNEILKMSKKITVLLLQK